MDRNIAVVGCGPWGQNLVRNFAELGALHTVCDTDPETLKQVASLYPDANTESEYPPVLKNESIKGVVIASPAGLHYSMARQALLSHKDVFVEKPLALKLEEGKELVAMAEEKRRVLMVGHLLEYHPAITRLKEMVAKGELGRIQYVYSNRLNLGRFRTEENVLWSFAPHDISAILFLLGGEMPQQVSAHGGYYLHQDIADVTLTTLAFRGGVRAHIFVSWLHPYKEQKLVLVGDRKMAVFDDTLPRDKLVLYSHSTGWEGQKPVPHPQKGEVIEVSPVEPLKLECQDFLKSIETRQTPKVDGRKGLQVLEILSFCQKSLEDKGRIVNLNPRGGEYFVHDTSLVEEPCAIGDGTKIWHFSHLMPHVKLGQNCVVGQNVFIGKGVTIGNNVKLENNVSAFEGVTLEDDVFCGPGVTFTNVKNPRSHVSRKHEFKPTLVGKGATIGANATIVCGNRVGEYAFVGAGSVVTKDVPSYALVYGNPASVRGWVCQCGDKLEEEGTAARCLGCGMSYTLDGMKCSPLP